MTPSRIKAGLTFIQVPALVEVTHLNGPTQHNAISGVLAGGRPASRISIPRGEGSRARAKKKGSKCPSPLPSSHIPENLVLSCFTPAQSFGPLFGEHQLPPGRKGDKDSQWPACPVLAPWGGHPFQQPEPSPLRQTLGIPNAVRLVFVESLSNILAHVCYFWDCFHNPFKTQKCLRKRQGSFFFSFSFFLIAFQIHWMATNKQYHNLENPKLSRVFKTA